MSGPPLPKNMAWLILMLTYRSTGILSYAHPVLFQKILLFSAAKSRIYPRLTNSRHIMISKTIGYPLIKRERWSFWAWDDEMRVLRLNISILPWQMVRSKVLLHFIAQYTHAPKDKVLDHAPCSFLYCFLFLLILG